MCVALPFVIAYQRQILLSVVVIYAIVAVSLVMLTGWAGQISLGQWGIAGVGTVVASLMAFKWHQNFFLTLLVAGIVGAVASLHHRPAGDSHPGPLPRRCDVRVRHSRCRST